MCTWRRRAAAKTRSGRITTGERRTLSSVLRSPPHCLSLTLTCASHPRTRAECHAPPPHFLLLYVARAFSPLHVGLGQLLHDRWVAALPALPLCQPAVTFAFGLRSGTAKACLAALTLAHSPLRIHAPMPLAGTLMGAGKNATFPDNGQGQVNFKPNSPLGEFKLAVRVMDYGTVCHARAFVAFFVASPPRRLLLSLHSACHPKAHCA